MIQAIHRFFAVSVATFCAVPVIAGDCCRPAAGQYSQYSSLYSAPQSMTYSYSTPYVYPSTYGNYSYSYAPAYAYPANYSYNYNVPAQTMSWQPMVLAPAATPSSGSGTPSADCSGSLGTTSQAKGSQALAQLFVRLLESGKFSPQSIFEEDDPADDNRVDNPRRDDVATEVGSRLANIESRLKRVEVIVSARMTEAPAKDKSQANRKQLRKIRQRLDDMNERTNLMYRYLETQPEFQEFRTKLKG